MAFVVNFGISTRPIGAFMLEAILIESTAKRVGSLNALRNDNGGQGRPPRGCLWYFVYLATCQCDSYYRRCKSAAELKRKRERQG